MNKDLNESTLYSLMYKLNSYNADDCTDLDPYISKKLTSLDHITEVSYYLCYRDLPLRLPLTKNKINKLILDELKEEKFNWNTLKLISQWLDSSTNSMLLELWFQDETTTTDSLWVLNSIDSVNDDIKLKIIDKLLYIYKNKKSGVITKIIENLFSSVEAPNVENFCKVIAKSTPAIKVCFLSRADISEKYTIDGIKALSKLSKQKDIDAQIDFKMLGHLGPKSRLDAMKQFMGLFNKHYQYMKKYENLSGGYYYRNAKIKYEKTKSEYKSPFKVMPSRKDVELFLFPCCLKYNEEVVALIKRYDEIITNT